MEDFESPEFRTTFILGARSVGKTISAISKKLKHGYDNETMYIYLRRYQTEIDTLGINISLISRLVGHDVAREKVKLDNGPTVDMLTVDSQPVMYLLALSVTAKYKSNSFGTDEHPVKEIIYDEFIDQRGRELKNEVFLYTSFAQTVFRNYKDYRALFLANSTDLYNAYFLEFEIMPKSRITKFRDLSVKIVMYQTSKALQEERLSTPLAKMVRKVEGEDSSSLDNVFTNAFDDFLTKLNRHAEQKMIFSYAGELYGYWDNQGVPTISKKVNPHGRIYAMTRGDVRENQPLISESTFSILRGLWEHSHLYFTDTKTRTQMIKYFKEGRYFDF